MSPPARPGHLVDGLRHQLLTILRPVIPAGQPVLMLYQSANRDEAEFGPDAGTFDVGRRPNHHLAFGFGPHFCIGAALARMEIATLLEALLDRGLRPERRGPAERTASPVIAGVRHLPLELTPA